MSGHDKGLQKELLAVPGDRGGCESSFSGGFVAVDLPLGKGLQKVLLPLPFQLLK